MISSLISRSEKLLIELESDYKSSLHEKLISDELKIDIKNLCENLRSVLDYLAHDMREKYCPNENPNDRFYFPISDSRTSFESAMSRSYPNFRVNCPALWNYLESIQPYNGNPWLSQFNKVNNENKHEALIEQARKETEEVRVTASQGAVVSWNPSMVKFGAGVSVNGVPIDPRTQMPIPNSTVKVERITWVDFQFKDINVSALGLLKQSLAEIKTIFAEVQKHL